MKRMAVAVSLGLLTASSSWASPPSGRVAGSGAASVSVAGAVDVVASDGTTEAFLFVVAYSGMVVSGGASSTSMIALWCELGAPACVEHEPSAVGIGTQPGGGVVVDAYDADLGAVHLEWEREAAATSMSDYRVMTAQFCAPGSASTWFADLRARFFGEPMLADGGARRASARGTVGLLHANGGGVMSRLSTLEYSVGWRSEPCRAATT